jgi:hypothetical protein
MASFVIWGGSFGGMAAGSALLLRQKGRELRQILLPRYFWLSKIRTIGSGLTG